jgi:hypothetical protein
MYFDFKDFFSIDLKDVLSKHKLTTDDILWIGSKDGKFSCPWEDFKWVLKLLAVNSCEFEYTSLDLIDYCKNNTLVLVGNDWWLEPERSSGREYGLIWNFHKLPIRSNDSNCFKYLPGEISVGYVHSDKPLKIVIPTYSNDSNITKMLNALDEKDYLREDFPLEDYDLTVEDLPKLQEIYDNKE